MPSLPSNVPIASDAVDSTAARVFTDVRERTVVGLLTAVVGAEHTASILKLLDAAQGNLRTLSAVQPADLREHGFTTSTIEKFSAVFEIARRYGEVEWAIGASFTGSYDVYAHFRERLAIEPVEHFYAILLDNKHRKLKEIRVSQGSLTASIVHPRDVYLPVIRESAAAVIFVHNHPSGDATPSAEDLKITRRLRDVGDLVGVKVLDHVIIGKGRYVSFVDDGYW